VPKSSWRVSLAVAAAVAWCAWQVGGWGGEDVVRAVDTFGMTAFAVFACACAGIAARSESGRQRRAWMWLTVGLAGYAVAAAICAVYVLEGLEMRPFPSLADAGYLTFKVAACLALVLYPVGFSGHSRARILLDGLIVAIALFEVAWVVVLRDVYETGAETRLALWTSVAYLVTGICLLTVAVLVLARARTDHRRILLLLTAGIVANALSGSAFVYMSAHDVLDKSRYVDIGRVAALLALGTAALLSRRAQPTGVQNRTLPADVSVWLPYLPVVVATAVCSGVFLGGPGFAPVVVSSVLLVFAVLARQFVAVRENRRLLAMTADQALRDPLTGLANRALFHDRLTHAIQLNQQRHDQSVAVLLLDLDDFKLVNDTLGHPAGDALLVMVAERILHCVRSVDTVARLGGDEFAILMEGWADHSRLVAQRVVQVFDDPFLIEGHDILVRPSVGLAVAAAEGVDITADALMKQADVAMYSAKRARSSGVHSFTPDMYLLDANETGLAHGGNANGGAGAVKLLGQLRHAIDNGGLALVYQPKFDLRDETIVGVEALVRWPHAERGVLGPDQFLPLVREHGLMRSVTELVLTQAVDDAARWHSRRVGVPVAVNIFAPSLGDLHLPKQILKALARRNLSTDALTLEMTEDVLADNMDRTRTVLERLRHYGIRVAIDDFGSGYSALSYLHDLPIDEVKLDRQFIAPVLVDWRAAAIVQAVINLAHVLGVRTVAEGVEDAVTVARLREFGCDVAQGYHYSPPVTADEMLEILVATSQEPAAAKSS
jgi:diguanylate cyclase (GGDEF)-like protein